MATLHTVNSVMSIHNSIHAVTSDLAVTRIALISAFHSIVCPPLTTGELEELLKRDEEHEQDNVH